MKSILIIGAGFAGSQLAKKLLKRGDRVGVIDIIAPLQNDRLRINKNQENFEYKWKSLQDLAAQADVPMGFTSPKWTVEQNVMGTICLLEAVKNVRLERCIYAGNGNEWGRGVYIPIDENHPLTPHNPYAFSKAAAEMAMWTYFRCYNVPIVIMSNGCVVGPGMRKEIFVFKWLYKIMKGLPVMLEGGEQTRDITYTDDVIQAWLLAIDAKADDVIGQKFQVSEGEELSVSRILNICLETCECKVPVLKNPYRPGEAGQRECFSNDKARKILGYRPSYSPEETIRLTRDWILEEYSDELTIFQKDLGGQK